MPHMDREMNHGDLRGMERARDFPKVKVSTGHIIQVLHRQGLHKVKAKGKVRRGSKHKFKLWVLPEK